VCKRRRAGASAEAAGDRAEPRTDQRRRTYDALHGQRRGCGNVVVRAAGRRVYAIAVVVDDFIDRIMVDRG
jgi:hypothetical protein